LPSSTSAAAWLYFLPCAIAFDVDRVEVGHLDLGDVADLLLGNAADLLAAGGTAALLDAGCLAQQVRGGRCLEDEAEAAVFVDGDLGRDDLARLGGRLLVVALAELDDVDAVRAEGGTDRRRGRCFAGRQLELPSPTNETASP